MLCATLNQEHASGAGRFSGPADGFETLPRASGQARDARLARQLREAFDLDPSQRVGFPAPPQARLAARRERIAQVEVEMIGLASARRDLVDVEVDERAVAGVREWREVDEPRFLLQLAQRAGERRHIAGLDVSA